MFVFSTSNAAIMVIGGCLETSNQQLQISIVGRERNVGEAGFVNALLILPALQLCFEAEALVGHKRSETTQELHSLRIGTP
jgi:hypothetical protein